ncbi:tetratricopeptide repeat protein, partial [Pseudanabaenaceae cyanobacterium LEGE 13415]|nr:tetratricopeptide repeat protein [Pseudanabaenaceae cyanobacterium LEGE 13415]
MLPSPESPSSIDESVSTWLERGDELFQLQRYREAIAAYDKAIGFQSNYTAWFKRGIACENLQRFEDAIECYNKVVELQPEDYLAWFKRGAVLETLNQPKEALICYQQVIELQPQNYWAWHDTGKALETLKRYEEAVEAYDRAVQLKPNFQLAVESRRRILSQIQQVDSLYDLPPGDLEDCGETVSEDADEASTWLMRGMAFEGQSQFEAAMNAYDRALDLQPNDHLAWFKRATVLQSLQRFEDAIAAYDKMIELQPENYWAWNDRGKALEATEQYEEALLSYIRAIQIRADWKAAIKGRQRVLAKLNSGAQPQKQSTPAENYGAWFQKGQVLEKLQHHAEAAIAANQSVKLNPSDPEVLRWRGNTMYTLA